MGPRRAAFIWNNSDIQSSKGFGTRREPCGIGRFDQVDNDAMPWPDKAVGAAAVVTVLMESAAASVDCARSMSAGAGMP